VQQQVAIDPFHVAKLWLVTGRTTDAREQHLSRVDFGRMSRSFRRLDAATGPRSYPPLVAGGGLKMGQAVEIPHFLRFNTE
jgi:hypothetical protein